MQLLSQTTMLKWIAFVLGLGLTGVITKAVLTSAFASHWLDHPNHRSMHLQPIPRIGGISMMLAAAMGAVILQTAFPAVLFTESLAQGAWTIIVCLLILGLIGAFDDRYELSTALRLISQLGLAALWSATFLGVLQDGLSTLTAVRVTDLVLVLIASVGITWGINLYNFMDGINGIAGLMGLVGLAVMALICPDQGTATALALGAGCCAGFLMFNLGRPKTFMGDAGSTTLGFICVTTGIFGVSRQWWSAWIPLLLFAPFWLDASITLLRRILKGERVWLAHRNHLYQRLVATGLGHTFVSLAYSITGGGCALILLMVSKLDVNQTSQLAAVVGPTLLGLQVLIFAAANRWIQHKVTS